MKKLFFLFTLISACSFAFGQSNDLQAKYLYSKAEDSYTKNQFAEAINLCEQAAEKLGQTNQKILFLELESYAALLNQNSDNPLFDDVNKIDNYLDLYLNKLSKSADDEKIIAVMKFKDQWTGHKIEAHAVSVYYDQYLGLTFKDSYYPEVFGTTMRRFWEITAISDGPFKNAEGIDEGKNGKVKPLRPSLKVGFLVNALYVYTKDGMQDMVYLYSYGSSPVGPTISSNEIKTKINAWLKGLIAVNHQSRKIEIQLVGKYIENDKKTEITFIVELHPLKD